MRGFQQGVKFPPNNIKVVSTVGFAPSLFSSVIVDISDSPRGLFAPNVSSHKHCRGIVSAMCYSHFSYTASFYIGYNFKLFLLIVHYILYLYFKYLIQY